MGSSDQSVKLNGDSNSLGQSCTVLERFSELFSENTTAKLLRVAIEALQDNVCSSRNHGLCPQCLLYQQQNPPTMYPEYVPQNGPDTGKYIVRDADFWTCGFFPGMLYLLRERSVYFPQTFPWLARENEMHDFSCTAFRQKLISLCQSWTDPLREMALRTDTHDLGFMLQPAFRKDWELTSNENSLQTLLLGAESLATRFERRVGAIRSWDTLRQKDVCITSLTEDFLVIIDSMCNLDLLFYASKYRNDTKLADIATKHARTLLTSHLRHEVAPAKISNGYKSAMYSTYHVVNFNPKTGLPKEKRTAQGYRSESTWARGQAWAILGYAQTYGWTGEKDFLSAACGLADYFLWRLETAPSCVERPSVRADRKQSATTGRYVPLWDFDAPIEDEDMPLRDSSAGVIAANGMLLLSQLLAGLNDIVSADKYRVAAFTIVDDTLEYSLSSERAKVVSLSDRTGHMNIEDKVASQRFDSILKNATANHNARDNKRYSDHGLVYADFYLLEFGNQLLRMGFR